MLLLTSDPFLLRTTASPLQAILTDREVEIGNRRGEMDTLHLILVAAAAAAAQEDQAIQGNPTETTTTTTTTTRIFREKERGDTRANIKPSQRLLFLLINASTMGPLWNPFR